MRRLVRSTVLAVVLALSGPALADASTLTVTTTADSNDGGCTPTLCSFRDAITYAGTGDTVVVPAGHYIGSMLGSNGVWSPGGAYTIQGAGAGQTIIDGNHLSRTFAFYGQITVTGVTVTGGQGPLAGCECGGAFEVRQGGFLTLINSVVQGNSAPGGGGGIDVDTQSKAILQNDLISQNSAPDHGGGIHVGPVSGNNGTLVMTNVTISGNSTSGGANGAGLDNEGFTTGTNVTFAGNSSSGAGGGVMNESTGMLTLTNSTIATNLATGPGAGIRNAGATGNLALRNTIVSDGCSGGVFSQGHNLDTGSSCAFGQTGDLSNTSPVLGPLLDNGGPVPTMALMAGSAAINAGDNAGCPATDARGVSRPHGSLCDIGAYEFAPPTVAPLAPTGLTSSHATLRGTVNPNLRDATYQFDYGTTPAYGSSTTTADAGAGNSAVPVAAAVNGLAPNTTYYYRLVATNGDGTSSAAGTFRTSKRSIRPVLRHVKQSAKRWIEPTTKPHSLPVGTTFSFTLNEDAVVNFRFFRLQPGRRVGGKCVPQTKHNKGKPLCRLSVAAGSFTFSGHAGKNKVSFKGRLPNGHRLAPGRYTLLMRARNTAGQRSAPKALTFTIVG